MKTKKKQILIVDDELIWLRSMATELRKVGYQVKEAQSASQAISLLAEYHPDLIVSDLRMPDMNGFDLLDKIRHSPSIAATPVVFFSAIDDFHATKVARELGATACLLKPYDKQDLIGLLKQYLPQ